MKTIKILIAFTLLIVCNYANSQNVTIYLSTSGGTVSSDKWVNITTGINGSGTVVWAQGNGTIGNGAGLLSNQAISIATGTTYYLNAYDKSDNGWENTIYTLKRGNANTSPVIINNGGITPNDGTDTDATANWDGTSAELERSESFSVTAPAGYTCGFATPITDGYVSPAQETSPGNDALENWVTSATLGVGDASSAGFVNSDVRIYSYSTGATAGESMYFTIEYDEALHGPHSIAAFSSCSGGSLTGCLGSSYEFDNIVGICVQNLAANSTYYLAVAKEWYSLDGENLNFRVVDFTVETSQTIPSDECSTASSINVADPYTGSTRCTYSASAGSPSTFPNSCGSIENDSWMKFVAGSSDVVIDYEVMNCSNDDGVQLSIFRGDCTSLTMLTGSCINYAANNSTATWTLTGLTIGATYYIRTDGYAGDLCSYSFNPVSGVVILPIELISFEVAALDNKYNKIKWITLSEANTSHFELERSENGKDFYSVKTIKAAGNSTDKLIYQEFDLTESGLMTYYRLKCTDFDGKVYHSEIRSIINQNIDDVKIYPNPSNDGNVSISRNSNKSFNEVAIYDLQGSQIQTIKLDSKALIKLDLTHLAKGVYYLKFSDERTSLTKKLILE